jgi:aspartyl protease family protein
LLAAVALGLWALSRWFPVSQTQMDSLNLVQWFGFLALASSGLLYARKVKAGETARGIALWLAVGAGLVLAFSFQDQLLDVWYRLRSAVIPSYPVQTGTGEMAISESPGGSYLVHGSINGTPVAFLVDTGASDIVLSPADARRIGVDMESLKFDHAYETANGQGRGAPYRVATLKVGGIVLHDVAVSINQAPMRTSLLGMSFLRRLKSFGFGDHKMVLRW